MRLVEDRGLGGRVRIVKLDVMDAATLAELAWRELVEDAEKLLPQMVDDSGRRWAGDDVIAELHRQGVANG